MEAGDGVPAWEERRMYMIVCEDMMGTKETVARGTTDMVGVGIEGDCG